MRSKVFSNRITTSINAKILLYQSTLQSEIVNIDQIKFVLDHIDTVTSSKCNYIQLFNTQRTSSASEFHKACDSYSPTLTIIRSSTGQCFGGYTTVKWNSELRNEQDPTGFLFSVDKQKIILRDGGGNRCSSQSLNRFGPTFGSGHDLLISNNPTENKSSYNDLKSSFGVFDPTISKYYLTNGEKYFKVDRYEVYLVNK